MKIVCDSCGAKYSIADEKVAGKDFKIRCKKCNHAIVVRGSQGASAAAAAAPFDYGSEATWHAVVDGDQQGPFTPGQIGEMIAENRIGWDAYVWKEGFDDWKPAQDVEELVQAIMNPAGAPAADPFADAPSAAPAVAAATPAPAMFSAPAASKREAADLFAGGGDADDDLVASAPSPRVSGAQAMSGQRNENSVLFSLSNLTALATGNNAGGGVAAPKAVAAAPKAGMATGEGSGLIDIRALASATSAPIAAAPAAARVDDLLSIGAPTAGFAGGLAAPVIIPDKAPEKSNTALFVGGGLAAVAIVAVAAVTIFWMMREPAAVAVAPTTIAPGPAPTAAVAAVAPGAGPAVVAPAAPAPAPVAAPAAPAVAAEAAPAPAPAEESGSGGRRRRGGGGGGGGGGTSVAAAETAPAAAAEPAAARRSSSSDSIDDLLAGALAGGGSRRAPAAAPAASGGGGAASGPESPSRSDVMSAMQGVTPAVTACGEGQHGTATVAITVQGTTGRVTGANVSGQFAGTPVGSCIARAVRGARFSPFTRPTFTVNYPFRL